MSAQDRLRSAIDAERTRLRTGIPANRRSAILAVVRAQDRRPPHTPVDATPDLITSRRLTNIGGNEALRLCLEAESDDDASGSSALPETLDDWTERFLVGCDRLAEAELVLSHVETGFMRLVESDDGSLDAWIATKRTPTVWREREDIDWWAARLARSDQREARAGQLEPTSDADRDRLVAIQLEAMSYQFSYPRDGTLLSIPIETYRAVLQWLISAAFGADQAEPLNEAELIESLIAETASDAYTLGQVVDAFTLDRENAAYHAAVPGVAAAPLIRLDGEHLVWSRFGLLSEPLFFLNRELRRRDAQGYHNSAQLREGVFRHDLYALFADKRFVTSPRRIELKREAGNIRTDIDALIFDRKTGTLGIFELKSQDPFARTSAELTRQRDNVLYANRQISGVLAWVKQHGGDALLARVDAKTAKTFRVQRVLPFVLGRYLVHFNDGSEPDRRAAWGTWPQVLRLLDSQPNRSGDANPLLSLFTRLTKDIPSARPIADQSRYEIRLGPTQLVIHVSHDAYRQ